MNASLPWDSLHAQSGQPADCSIALCALSLPRLLGLGTPQLRLPRLLLPLPLTQLHRRRAGDSLSAQIAPVALLGRRADDGAVQLARGRGGGEGGLVVEFRWVVLLLGELPKKQTQSISGCVGIRVSMGVGVSVYLGDHLDGVAVGRDANGLVIAVALVLAAVLVDEVQRVAGELDAAGLLALAEVGVGVACIYIILH